MIEVIVHPAILINTMNSLPPAKTRSPTKRESVVPPSREAPASAGPFSVFEQTSARASDWIVLAAMLTSPTATCRLSETAKRRRWGAPSTLDDADLFLGFAGVG
jgi:hypothetical protein